MEQVRLLVCEDEALVARDIQGSLEESGYEVVGVATCPEQALLLAEEHKPDLAIMDINLNSSVDGIQVAGVLREHFEIPSIYLTAFADSDTIEFAKETQPLGYLIKPFNDRELFTTIEMGINRLREQKKALEEIEHDYEVLCDDKLLQTTVEYEQELANTKKRHAFRRILKRVADEIGGDVFIVAKQLEKICSHKQVTSEIGALARTAFVHQEYVAFFLDSLRRMGEDKPLEFKTVSVRDIILEAMTESSSPIESEAFFATTFYEKPLFVAADQGTLKHSLLHIFSNAKQACPSSPIVNIETSLVYEEFPERYNEKAESGSYVRVSVTDYGPGMDERQLEQALEPLFTNDSSGFHWGLGLPTVDNIVQRHGGWMRIESDQEMATIVSLYLPEVKKASAARKIEILPRVREEEEIRQTA